MNTPAKSLLALTIGTFAISGCGGSSGTGSSSTTGSSSSLSAIQARLQKAGYTTTKLTSTGLNYPNGHGGFGRASAGLDIKTPRGTLSVLVIPDAAQRAALVKLEKGTYPVAETGEDVWLTGSPASGGLGPQNAAYFNHVVKTGTG